MLRLILRGHVRQPCLSPFRRYSTLPEKPSIQQVAELRKLMPSPLTKALEALAATNNDVDAALDWMQRDLLKSGKSKAAEVEGREANEGLISISVLSRGIGSSTGWGVRSAMIELNCETDFVGRSELFGTLAADITHTAAFLTEPIDAAKLPVFYPLHIDHLHDAPLLSHSEPQTPPTSTVREAIRDAITMLGEKVSLRRAATLIQDAEERNDRGVRIGSYVHGSVNNPLNGRMGALVSLMVNSPRLPTLLRASTFVNDLQVLERALARQVVGFDPSHIMDCSDMPRRERNPLVLYDQPFATFPENNMGDVVEYVLEKWAVERGLVNLKEKQDQLTEGSALSVTAFQKWTVGGPLD